jgi:hypothetical protein
MAMIIINPLIGRVVDALQSYDVIGFGLAVWVIPGALIWLVWRPAAHFDPGPTLPRAHIT